MFCLLAFQDFIDAVLPYYENIQMKCNIESADILVFGALALTETKCEYTYKNGTLIPMSAEA